MKPIKKPVINNSTEQQSVSSDKPCSNRIHITLVSEKERDLYCVPSYGFLLP